MANNKTSLRMQLGTVAAATVLCWTTAFGQMQSPGAPQGAMQPNSAAGRNNSMNNMDQMQSANGAPSMTDKMFLTQALEGSMAEIQTAQLALSKTSNDQVKQFAQRMIDDHTKLIEQTKPVAMQLGADIPNGPSKKDKARMAKLQALSGNAFDQAYMKDMVKDHKTDNSAFMAEAQSGQSQQVKELAAKGDTVVQSHLQMAEQISKAINQNSGM